MSTQLNIERLTFTFGDTWTFATKWDDEWAYRSGISKLHGVLDGSSESTKAVDLVAVQNGTLVLAEAKDFRPAIDCEAGMTPNALAYAGRWEIATVGDRSQGARYTCGAGWMREHRHPCEHCQRYQRHTHEANSHCGIRLAEPASQRARSEAQGASQRNAGPP
ncbi:MAG: hypothetical protein QM784_19300 [Polyangiaceae bacterium]